MKILRVFRRDLKVNLRSFLPLWILAIPLILAAVICAAAPGITDSFLNIAMLKSSPAQMRDFYGQYVKVELFDNVKQAEARIMRSDHCLGLLPDASGGYEIVSQGNEPSEVVDALALLSVYEEKGTVSSSHVTFTDLGRSASPLKSVLLTGLLILVTILAGMMISLNLVEEKSDGTIRAMRVTPLSITGFVIGKGLAGAAYTMICGFAILLIGGYLPGPILPVLGVLLASALISMLIGFLVGLSSNDFITAAGNMKVIMMPALAAILVTELAVEKWHWMVWWSPFYWSYDSLKGLLDQTVTAARVFGDCAVVLGITALLGLILIPRIGKRLK